MMGRLPWPPPCSHHATDRWPWGQRTCCWSQSTANWSIVYAPSTWVCQPWLGRVGPRRMMPCSSRLWTSNSELSELLVHSRDEQGIILRGPTRPSQGWQTQVDGAYTIDQFAVDWDQQQVRCPQGHLSVAWWEHGGGQGSRPIIVEFDKHTCGSCPVRAACTRAKHTGRRLRLPPQDH